MQKKFQSKKRKKYTKEEKFDIEQNDRIEIEKDLLKELTIMIKN